MTSENKNYQYSIVDSIIYNIVLILFIILLIFTIYSIDSIGENFSWFSKLISIGLLFLPLSVLLVPSKTFKFSNQYFLPFIFPVIAIVTACIGFLEMELNQSVFNYIYKVVQFITFNTDLSNDNLLSISSFKISLIFSVLSVTSILTVFLSLLMKESLINKIKLRFSFYPTIVIGNGNLALNIAKGLKEKRVFLYIQSDDSTLIDNLSHNILPILSSTQSDAKKSVSIHQKKGIHFIAMQTDHDNVTMYLKNYENVINQKLKKVRKPIIAYIQQSKNEYREMIAPDYEFIFTYNNNELKAQFILEKMISSFKRFEDDTQNNFNKSIIINLFGLNDFTVFLFQKLITSILIPNHQFNFNIYYQQDESFIVKSIKKTFKFLSSESILNQNNLKGFNFKFIQIDKTFDYITSPNFKISIQTNSFSIFCFDDVLNSLKYYFKTKNYLKSNTVFLRDEVGIKDNSFSEKDVSVFGDHYLVQNVIATKRELTEIIKIAKQIAHSYKASFDSKNTNNPNFNFPIDRTIFKKLEVKETWLTNHLIKWPKNLSSNDKQSNIAAALHYKIKLKYGLAQLEELAKLAKTKELNKSEELAGIPKTKEFIEFENLLLMFSEWEHNRWAMKKLFEGWQKLREFDNKTRWKEEEQKDDHKNKFEHKLICPFEKLEDTEQIKDVMQIITLLKINNNT